MNTELEDRARMLIELCRRLETQDQEEDQFERITKVRDDLLERQEQLNGALAFLQKAQDDDVAFAEERKSLNAKPLQEALAKGRASLAEGTVYDPGPIDGVLKPLENFAQAAVLLAGKVWTAHWQGTVQARRELLDALEKLPDLRSEIAELRHLEGQVHELASLAVPSPEDYIRFRTLVGDLNDRWAALQISSDPEVENFLTKAATGGAAIDDLTQDVRDWLNERGLADQFVIQPGSPS